MTLGLKRTPDGYRIEIGRTIDAPRDVLWHLLTDTARWSDWIPTIDAVDCRDRYIQRGVRGRVRGIGGFWIPFRITACSDYRWSWTVGPPSAGAFDLAPHVPATGHRIEEDPDQKNEQETEKTADSCRVVLEIPPLVAGYAVVCERALVKLDRIAAREI